MNQKNVCIFISSIVLGLILGFFADPALAQDSNNVQVEVNGQLVTFPDQGPFINKDNRTLVPVRAPMEKAGAKVDWEGTSQTVTVSKNGIAAVFVIGADQYKVNGESKTMDTRAQIVNGRTCFPIRFVAEALGMKVDWDQSIQTVKITEQPSGNNPITPTVTPPVEEIKPQVESAQKPMTNLSLEAKARLMSYPYPVDKNGKQYEIPYPMVEFKEWTKENGRITTDVLEYMLTPIQQFSVLKANQRFITDADLCYYSRNSGENNRIRGILQTTNHDGTIMEQDIEYGFSYGTVFVKPGEATIPSHWFSEYETVQLSVPVKVK